MQNTCLSLIAILSVTFAGTRVYAQDWAKQKLNDSRRHMEWVTVESNNRKIKCFIGYPETKDKATSVILIHEIFGLSDWVRSVCDELAAEGFIVIAPDLLSSENGGSEKYQDADAIRKAVSALPPEQVISDVKAVEQYTSKLPAANGKCAPVGFCWGGSQVWRVISSQQTGTTLDSPTRESAGFVFYGTANDTIDPARITAPVFGFYGSNDSRVTSTVASTSQRMSAAHVKFEPVTYDAGHGFMRVGDAPDADDASKKARNAAFSRLVSELKKL